MKRLKFSLAHKITLLLINAGVILALLCMYFRSRDPGSLWTGAVALLILPVLAGGGDCPKEHRLPPLRRTAIPGTVCRPFPAGALSRV